MSLLTKKLKVKLEQWRNEVKGILEKRSEKVISEVTVGQAYGGMRGVRSLICDTSCVPQDEGLIIRGIHLKELMDRTPEEIYFLLLTGELPSKEEFEDLSGELKERKSVPEYVWNILKAMPGDSHPMTMFNTALLVMQNESVFAKNYNEGIKKADYWLATLQDALNIIARVPAIAAGVYRLRFNKGGLIKQDPSLNMTEEYVHQLGFEEKGKEFNDLIRLYLVAHSDHEGGNVSALATQTINSALSDLYYSLSGGFNGLAGPLHGLANQEALKWILELMEKFNGSPTREQIKELVWQTLESGKIIPGYGHAVLRVTDPRFEGFLNFGKKYLADNPIFITVNRMYEVIPEELKKINKIKNPYPNVDAVSGTILYYYGLKEFAYYTVMFAVSRTLGLTAQAVINRGMMNPIIRPKSVTTKFIKDLVG
ncbi:MAG TPA: citrate (Si)-synthase [Ignavibacteriaceae bacterium]|nr:citrate (Si)-synthase [Ignavibacteriaceae bacterium]